MHLVNAFLRTTIISQEHEPASMTYCMVDLIKHTHFKFIPLASGEHQKKESEKNRDRKESETFLLSSAVETSRKQCDKFFNFIVCVLQTVVKKNKRSCFKNPQ
jgi:hypothetical protein